MFFSKFIRSLRVYILKEPMILFDLTCLKDQDGTSTYFLNIFPLHVTINLKLELNHLTWK